MARELGIVAAHILDEAFGVLAADEDLKLDTEREVDESESSIKAKTASVRLNLALVAASEPHRDSRS